MTRVGNVPAIYHGVPSHNTFLTIMAELGVIGLGLYLFPVIWWLFLSSKAGRRLPSHGFLSWRLLVLLWLLMLHMFIVNNSMDMQFFVFGTTVWWMALGLIANLVDSPRKPGEIRALGTAQQAVGHQ
jgi:O-antigen ligase